MLDYRIQTFLTLYQEMNYRRTAEKLNITQPGVTQHIQYLERLYQTKLFSYDGRTLSRTKNAEILKRHVSSVLSEEREMAREFLGRKTMRLSIGATKTIGEFVLVPIVREFLKNEDHSVDLVIDNTECLLDMLEDAMLDFAVVEGVFDKTKYPHHLYKKEHFVGICSASHPFAHQKVGIDEMFRETLIVREPGSGTRRLLEQAITDRGYSLSCFRRVNSVSNFSVIIDMLSKDDVISFAYEPVADSSPALATFEVEDMVIRGEFNFVYCNRDIAKEKIRLLFGA